MRKTSVERICEQCDKTFEIQPYRLKVPPEHLFCSRHCRSQWYKGKPRIGHKLHVDTAQLVTEYARGDSLREIGERYGVTLQAVRSKLKTVGMPRRRNAYQGFRVNKLALDRAREHHPRGAEHPMYRVLPLADVRAAYEAGESTAVIAKRYNADQGTIIARLKEMGVKIRARGYRQAYRASDGHVVFSAWELAVDEWLISHGVAHEVQPSCPWRVPWTREHHVTHQEADFRVGDIYIEVWGMVQVPQYQARRQRKLAQYREHNIPLIQIFPHHILDADYAPLEILLEC